MAAVSAIQSASERVAPRLALSSVGVIPAFLVPIIAAAFQALLAKLGDCIPQPTPQTAAEFLADNWIEKRQQFKAPVLSKASQQVRAEAKAQGNPIKPAESRHVAHQMLLEAMNTPQETLASAFKEAK